MNKYNKSNGSDLYELNYTRINERMDILETVITIRSPIIISFGTIGNILTFFVMQRGSLKHSSTCFYMSILALADTGKWILSTD